VTHALLALGAGPALVEVAKPGCRGRVRRGVSAWCATPEYLHALAAPGAMRHDRHGTPVEPAAEEHQADARQRLARLERRTGRAA
jgi:sRNA-binding protein